ncbi:phage head morphogenesis protein [Bradyrhizobium sp.]
MKRKGERILRPVHPNAGLAADYRAKLDAIIEAMQRSYVWWIKAQYRENPPALAMDDAREREMHRRTRQREETHAARKAGEQKRRSLPAKDLERELSLLGKRWQAKIDEAAPKLAEWFAKSTSRRSSAALKKILKDGGISVEFKMTPTMRDAYQATLAQNVGLIKSIGSEYHTEVQGMVMRSVATGRDLGGLTKELEARYGITRRRAALIAKSQNDLATSTFTRIRQLDSGITHAIWLHSAGGREPRPLHVKASGTRYDITVGLPIGDKGENVFPGQCINCRCVSKSIVRGFS